MKRDMVIYYDSPLGFGKLTLAVNEGDDVCAHAHDEAKHRSIQNFSVKAWEPLEDARAAAKRLNAANTGHQAFVEKRSAELRMERDFLERPVWTQQEREALERAVTGAPDFVKAPAPPWAQKRLHKSVPVSVGMGVDPASGPDQTVIATVHDEVILSISPAETPFVRKLQAARQYLAGDWAEPKPEESKALPALAGLGVVSDTFTGRLGNRWQP